MAGFSELGLKKEIVDVLSRLRFTEPTDVQKEIIPLALKGRPIVFTSRTGSGKTLAYLLGYISKINKKLDLQMIIMVPTRELCIQVGKEVTAVCEPLGIKVGVLYGGRDLAGDYRTTNRRNQIIIGTPGRLLDHVNAKNLKPGEVKYIVFDESDQMFDQGFFDDCAYMRKRVNLHAQVILASATITEKVEDFIKTVIKDYEFLQIGDIVPKNIVQEKVYCDKSEKQPLLIKLFQQKRFNRAMIFCNTKIKVFDITEALNYNNFPAKMLNSDLDQIKRQNTLNLFKDGKIKVLVTTDIAARGLQIESVDAVINYDAPTKKEFYVHRIGRTGRRDKAGYAIAFICREDVERFDEIEQEFDLKVEFVNKEFKRI